MPRVIGIDPGSMSFGLCGLDDGQVFLDQSLSTAEAVATPSAIVDLIRSHAPIDLVVGPSGYGLPLIAARDLTETDLRLAYLAARDERGGIARLPTLLRQLARAEIPVVLTPGVIHLATVPAHRKVNRVDMGTADKLCAVALAIREQVERRRCPEQEVSLILLELGAAFSAAVAVHAGRIVDGLGGSCGPLGLRAAGGLDAEVAFLAGAVTKHIVFGGGADAVAGVPGISAEALAAGATAQARVAWQAYVEGALKAVAALAVSVPRVREVILSGRAARIARVRDELARGVAGFVPDTTTHALAGFAAASSQAAQGAAVIADGLAGGASAGLVETLDLRGARGTVLDHLYVISPAAARARLGIVD